jgi:two-component system, NarL family, invasion response regulator UvrY
MVHNVSSDTPSISIGIAEDHNVVRSALVNLINSKFSKCEVVFEAADGGALIQQIEQANNPPDICILDIHMKKVNGLDTQVRLRERWPDIAILILTNDTHGYHLEKMIVAGANGHLVKDCEPIELEKALMSIYENGIYNPRKNGVQFFQHVLNNRSKFPVAFSEHEIELLKHCCSDMTYDQIAGKMGLSIGSLEWCRNNLFKKLNVKSRSTAVIFAIQAGIFQLNV